MTTQDTQPATDSTSAPVVSKTVDPTDDELQDDLFEVVTDQWGWRAEYTKGQVIRRGDPDSKHYDVDHAIRTGTLRPLTVSEARMYPAPAAQTVAAKRGATNPPADSGKAPDPKLTTGNTEG